MRSARRSRRSVRGAWLLRSTVWLALLAVGLPGFAAMRDFCCAAPTGSGCCAAAMAMPGMNSAAESVHGGAEVMGGLDAHCRNDGGYALPALFADGEGQQGRELLPVALVAAPGMLRELAPLVLFPGLEGFSSVQRPPGLLRLGPLSVSLRI